MKRFSSRYEKIRRLRAQQEDICRAAAAARNAERNAAEQARDAKRRWLETIERTAATDMSAGLSGALLNSIASEIDRGKNELRVANDVLKAAEDKLREALEHHKHARAELKIVEEVIHRERTEHRHEQLRIQEHQLQEQAAQAYFRRQETSRGTEP